MTTALPVPQTVLIRLKGVVASVPWNVIAYVQYTGTGPTVANLQTMATTIATAYSTNFAPLTGVSKTLTGIDLADLTNPSASAVSTTQSVVGTRTGAELSSQASCVTSWQINVRYKGGHPRSYWPVGIVTDLLSTRAFSSTFVTSMTNASNAWRTALNGLTHGTTTYKMVAVSRVADHALRPQPIVYTVNGVTVHGRVDTQRRRLGKEIP